MARRTSGPHRWPPPRQRLHVLLKREGYVINHKRLLRLYREEKHAVRRRGGRTIVDDCTRESLSLVELLPV
jgi:hypothetical protein